MGRVAAVEMNRRRRRGIIEGKERRGFVLHILKACTMELWEEGEERPSGSRKFFRGMFHSPRRKSYLIKYRKCPWEGKHEGIEITKYVTKSESAPKKLVCRLILDRLNLHRVGDEKGSADE